MAKAKATQKKETPAASKHSLSNQLRAVIESRGVTAYALGRDSGVDATVISRFLSQERDIRMETADKLAAALGLRLVEVGLPRPKGRPKARTAEG